MKQKNLIAYISIILAVDFGCWSLINPYWFILIDFAVLVLCVLINKFENWFSESNHKWIDKIYYAFTKNSYPYIVENRTIEYKILSASEAELCNTSEIIVKKAKDDFAVEGHYQWEQDKEIDFQFVGDAGFTCSRTESFNWVELKMTPGELVTKNQHYKVGFQLKGLQIKNLVRHSFLRVHITSKIKKIKLVAKVNKNLNPVNGQLVVFDSNLHKIKSEDIRYFDDIEKFVHNLHHPRLGRYYAIQWEYNITDGN